MAILGDSTAISMNVLNTVEAETIKKRNGLASQFLKADGSVDSNIYKTTDTLNTTGATNKTGTKMFIVGATSQDVNPVTYSNSSCYVGTDNCLYSGGSKVLTSYTNSFSTSAAFDGANANNGVKMTISGNTGFTSYNKTIPIANATNGTASWGVVKSTSTVTSTSGLSVCPIISGVVYYKDTDTKVTAVGNHYTPSGGSAAAQTSGSAIGWGGTAVTGITIDAAGHITGVTKGAIPSQPADTKNTAGATNSASKLFLVGATAQDANPQTYSNSAVFATGGVLSSNSIRLNASISGNTFPVEIYSVAEGDKFIKFGYDATTANAGASWCLGMLGSGSADTNYFVIRSGTSSTGASSWTNAVRIGQNTFDTGFAGHVYPIANGTKDLGTSSLKWNVVYGNKWNTATVGSSTQPVYLNGGVFTACSAYVDTKNTAGATNSASKLFLVGATAQDANPQTYSNVTVYEQAGTFAATQVRVAEACTLQYDSTNLCLKFVF